MADSSRFDFCDKCGALSRDGVCQSCGYKDPNYVPPVRKAEETQPVYGQQAVYNQQVQYSQQPRYTQYQAPKKNNSTLVIIILAVVILTLMLTCGIGFVVFALIVSFNATSFEQVDSGYEWEYDDGYYYEDDTYNDGWDYYEDIPDETTEYLPGQDVEGLESGKYYTELYSDFRYDLDYQVEMQYGLYSPEEYEFVMIDVEYPVIKGNAPNRDVLNEYLEYEYSYYVDYFLEEYEPYMETDSYFMVAAVPYVTYMDENVMSVVFQEEVVLDDFSAINFYCLNFDMKNGVLLNNTEILHMDEEFVIDFRKREILENGDEILTNFTDQEILEMLKDEDYLVIFYTPMGMEVGLNLGNVVIYMTYSDYLKYLNNF